MFKQFHEHSVNIPFLFQFLRNLVLRSPTTAPKPPPVTKVRPGLPRRRHRREGALRGLDLQHALVPERGAGAAPGEDLSSGISQVKKDIQKIGGIFLRLVCFVLLSNMYCSLLSFIV